MDDYARPSSDDDEGGGWIMTFADLMSLLMCFFVLLLSFAEMDINKFKAIAGSLRLAFGVQREVKAPETPVGTSVITQEFSPARPQPTAINEVRQTTMDANKQTLEFTDALTNEEDGENTEEGGDGESERDAEATETLADAQQLMEALREEIEQGMIQIETAGKKIIIRIREKASFPSGIARFRETFIPVVTRLRSALNEVPGRIVVAGHTDNVPIKTALYRSNWDLSAARAVSVVHELLSEPLLDPVRFVVEGHGDAHPLAPNDSAENRALNRRVELTIHQDDDAETAADEPIALLPVLSPVTDDPDNAPADDAVGDQSASEPSVEAAAAPTSDDAPSALDAAPN